MVSEYHPVPEMMQQREREKSASPLPKHLPPSHLRNIALVGMPAAGKSIVAKSLASILNREWLETDAKLEEVSSMSVADIFHQRGEDYFRKQETQILAELLSGTERIISTGGGAVLSAENRRMLKHFAWVVYLAAPVTMLCDRVLADNHQRPLLGEHPQKKLTEALAKREPLYQQIAHLVIVQQDGDTPARVARKIEAGLKHLIPV